VLQHYLSDKIICGVDEAGRGCIAGPVVAAAVILPKDFSHALINDSKKIDEHTRTKLEIVIKNEALAFGIGVVDNATIDKINILQATYLAMHIAIEQLQRKPELLIIDGNRFKPYTNIEYQTVVKGDATYIEIAAASILAKTHRDRLMDEYAKEFPIYNWQQNKGYPTPEHKKSVWRFGYSPLHRLTFNINKQLSLFE
jgi:ribonuclease HII